MSKLKKHTIKQINKNTGEIVYILSISKRLNLDGFFEDEITYKTKEKNVFSCSLIDFYKLGFDNIEEKSLALSIIFFVSYVLLLLLSVFLVVCLKDTYEYNKSETTVLNVYDKSIFLGRIDVDLKEYLMFQINNKKSDIILLNDFADSFQLVKDENYIVHSVVKKYDGFVLNAKPYYVLKK